MRQTHDRPNIKLVELFIIFGLGLVLPIVWLVGVQLVVFICSGISVALFYIQGIFRCHDKLFLSSPHVRLVICLIHLFVSYIDSSMG